MPDPDIFRLARGRKLLLRSASPRRSALLASVGLPFELVPAQGAEPLPAPDEPPSSFVCRAALAKSAYPAPNEIVLAADTVVTVDGHILGKPADQEQACAMLRMLNGRSHTVFSGVCLRWESQTICQAFATEVRFADWPEEVLQAYARTGEPLDKAGAYGIQATGGFLVEELTGSWSNVAGLPLTQLLGIMWANNLLEAGWHPFDIEARFQPR